MSLKIYGDIDKAIAGMKYGIYDDVETLAAGENIYPGDPVFGMVGDEKTCYGAHLSAISLTADADLVAGNTVTIVINNIVLAPVAFEKSSKDTIKKVINAIDLNQDVRALGIDAFFEESSPRAIFLQGPGITITTSATVIGGASRAAFSAAPYTALRFMGVARFQELVFGKETGYYPATVAVSVQTSGKVFVPIADNAAPDDKKAAYVILSGDNAGKFTDESTGNYDCGCFFRSERVSGDLALIELRGMK